MGRDTSIEWADSSLNLLMGCDGCELSSNGGSGTCYAENLTARYAGNKGWPASFFQPALFPERLAPALRWPDLTGTDRSEKPWLSGLPRHVFLDDMGDTFTESMPLDWIAPHIPAMEASPHVWMFLTKRPDRMRQFFEQLGRVPRNFMLGTSIIAAPTRLRDLCAIAGARLFVSAEPLWREIDLCPYLPKLSLVILGGESGALPRPFDLDVARRTIAHCRAFRVPVFLKQVGTFVVGSHTDWEGHRISGPVSTGRGLETRIRIHFKDKKGGDPSEWPEDLRIREFPAAGESPR